MTSRRIAELAVRTKLYDALRRIASYASPEKLRKTSEKEYGLQPDEAIEMAYENVIEEAKAAIRGMRRPAALLLLAVALLFALPMKAQNATAANEIILPIVVHASGSPSWGTEINLFNFSDDPVGVSMLFIPSNQPDNDPHFPLQKSFPKRFRIGPHLPFTLSDADLGKIIGPDAVGMLILDSCRAGASCEPVLVPFTHRAMTRFTLVNLPRQFRNISSEVRVFDYVETPKASWPTASRGDSYLAIPYWATVQPGDGPVVLHGIKVDASHATTIGFNNTSSYSTIMLRARLFDNLGVERDHWDEPAIEALLSRRRSAEAMFPTLAMTNRLNRQPAKSGWWIRVEMIASIPNELAAAQKDVADSESCFNGCPQFFAYASVTDNSPVLMCDPNKKALCIPDLHFIMPEFEVADRSRTGEPLLPSSIVSGGEVGVHSTAFRPATSQASPLCRVVGPNPHDGSWTIWRQKPGGKKDEMEPVTKAAAGQFKMAQAACSGAMGQ